MQNKSELRKWAKSKREELNIEELSQLLVQKLQKTQEYVHAKNVMIFYPLKNEINLLSLLDDTTKNFYLPKIKEENLLCCPYNKNEELCVSCFNTKEPLTNPVEKNLIDLVIVPALAVDINNYRLGYGGGYYDRFLKNISALKLVCIPQVFILKTIYPDILDIKIDKIITL